MRGVTENAEHHGARFMISTRTPHAGSDENQRAFEIRRRRFQPALPMRGVTYLDSIINWIDAFQPALPMRGVTVVYLELRVLFLISTRTPHAGSDIVLVVPVQPFVDFNPHSPCGE